jgi:hypothetical protein
MDLAEITPFEDFRRRGRSRKRATLPRTPSAQGVEHATIKANATGVATHRESHNPSPVRNEKSSAGTQKRTRAVSNKLRDFTCVSIRTSRITTSTLSVVFFARIVQKGADSTFDFAQPVRVGVTPDKSRNRKSQIHMDGMGVNRPSAPPVCFDYILERGFGITSV